jgi:hypothetical protein
MAQALRYLKVGEFHFGGVRSKDKETLHPLEQQMKGKVAATGIEPVTQGL